MALLTDGEYDDLPDECKEALGLIVQQPHKDIHSDGYRRRFGAYMNGETYADPIFMQKVGYGTGLPFVKPFVQPPIVPVPKVSIKPSKKEVTNGG